LPSMSSGNDYELVASTGQSGGVGVVVSDGADYEASDGFWYAAACKMVRYADIAPPGGDGVIDLNDILCVLDDFGNPANCAGNADIYPCSPPDGTIDLNDILSVLDAFGNNNACPDACL